MPPDHPHFAELLDELRNMTSAQRTTFRIDFQGHRFPIVAESLAEGMHSIRGDETFDLRKAASSRTVLDTKDILVQDDCSVGKHAPPAEFISRYGVRAQMLGPIVRDERVVGIVSVHSTEARTWTDHDIAELRSTLARLDTVLGTLDA